MYESTSQASPRFDANSASGIDVGFKGALDLLRAWRDGRTPDELLGGCVLLIMDVLALLVRGAFLDAPFRNSSSRAAGRPSAPGRRS